MPTKYIYQKNIFRNSLIRYLIFVIFWLITLIAIIYSLGLTIDWKNFKLYKTGTIYLSLSNILDCNIYLDDKLVATQLPATFSRLAPDYYLVSIKKSGFVHWSKSFNVEQAKVSAWDDILLFKDKIRSNPATEKEAKRLTAIQNEPIEETIKINKNELLVENILVTRFSEDIVNAVWHPDGSHIVFQIQNRINIIEIDGKNQTELVQLNHSEKALFRLLEKGRVLLYKDGDQIFTARLY